MKEIKVVETLESRQHHVANVRVEGSNPFARSNFPETGGKPDFSESSSAIPLQAVLQPRMHVRLAGKTGWPVRGGHRQPVPNAAAKCIQPRG